MKTKEEAENRIKEIDYIIEAANFFNTLMNKEGIKRNSKQWRELQQAYFTGWSMARKNKNMDPIVYFSLLRGDSVLDEAMKIKSRIEEETKQRFNQWNQ